MTTFSHNSTAVSKFTATTMIGLIAHYAKACNREALDWLFDQSATHTPRVLLVLLGMITEAINWF